MENSSRENQNIFTDAVAEMLNFSPLEQSFYLSGGELKPWKGVLQRVYSPVCRIENGIEKPVFLGSVPQLDEAAARRAADLRALVTPMPHGQASARPLAVLPPARVRVLNPAHELQALLATLFAGGAYARRMSALGTLMPDAAARRAYCALMSTLLARRLESEWAVGREQVRELLEDAWLHPMVQRRWAELMQQLTPAQCARVVRRALERGLAAGRARWLEPERAVEGWGA